MAVENVVMDYIDEYWHPHESGVLYFAQNILTKEAEVLFEYDFRGCKCYSECQVKSCDCAKRSGTTYRYKDPNNIDEYEIEEKSPPGPTYECNNNCGCKENPCGNRLAQFGPRKGLCVKECENKIKGLGLFTLRAVNKGNFICEYAGELITEEEATRRFKYYQDNGNEMNYIFCINEHFGVQTRKIFIDPTKYGNIGRYINHSCEPNCTLFVIRTDSTVPILGIFAGTGILENTELTYDYGETDLVSKTTESRKECYCASEKCRKYLPFDKHLL